MKRHEESTILLVFAADRSSITPLINGATESDTAFMIEWLNQNLKNGHPLRGLHGGELHTLCPLCELLVRLPNEKFDS